MPPSIIPGRVVRTTYAVDQPDRITVEATTFAGAAALPPPALVDGRWVPTDVVIVAVPEHPATDAAAADALIEILRWRRRLTSDGKNTYTLGGSRDLAVLDSAIAALMPDGASE